MGEKGESGSRATFRDWVLLGRFFGASATSGVILLGAFTSTTTPVELLDIVKLIIVGTAAHGFVGSINDYWHIDEDKKHPQYAYKPLVRGAISRRGAFAYVTACWASAMFLSVIFFPSFPAYAALAVAGSCGAYYTVKGKYQAWAYDFSPSMGAALLVVYGATAIGGPTLLTWVAAGCSFFMSVYAEWIDGMKDVATDRKFGVPTTAARWGYSHGKPLTLRDPNLQWFIATMLCIDILYVLPWLTGVVTPYYMYWFAIMGVPAQVYFVYFLLGRRDKESLRVHPLLFIGFMMFLAFTLVIDRIGILGILAMMGFIWGWVAVLAGLGIRFSKK